MRRHIVLSPEKPAPIPKECTILWVYGEGGTLGLRITNQKNPIQSDLFGAVHAIALNQCKTNLNLRVEAPYVRDGKKIGIPRFSDAGDKLASDGNKTVNGYIWIEDTGQIPLEEFQAVGKGKIHMLIAV